MNVLRFTQAMIALSVVTYLGLGLLFLFRPVETIQLVELQATTPAGATEVRAMYGGLELGIGLWLATTLRDQRLYATALLLVGVSLGGLGLARLSGLLMDGGWDAHAHLLAIEAVSSTAALATRAWWLRSGEPAN